MKKVYLKYLLLAVFPVFALMAALCMEETPVEAFTIVLDPGHGGDQSGAERETKEGTVNEKDLNLKIAKSLKKALEQYEDVTIILTREEDSTVDLAYRSKIAVFEEADLLVSLHNNAKGDICAYDHGCTVLVSKGQYKEELGQKEQELGVCILYELSQLGLENQGLLLRTSQNETTYPNGELADYYGIVKRGIEDEIPAIIVEHAFLDSDSDYEEYLSTDEKLADLAEADARGIARYYDLKYKDVDLAAEETENNRNSQNTQNKEETEESESTDPLKNRKEKLVWVKDEDAAHNEVSYKVFFE